MTADTGWITINPRRAERAWGPGERCVISKSRSKRGVWKWFYYEGGVARKRGMEPSASEAAAACSIARARACCGACTDAFPDKPFDAYLVHVPDIADMCTPLFVVTGDESGYPVTIIPKVNP